MSLSYRLAYCRDLMTEWLEQVERGLNRVPPLRAFIIRMLICRLGITSLPLLLVLSLLTAVVAVLLVVGIVGASVSW